MFRTFVRTWGFFDDNTCVLTASDAKTLRLLPLKTELPKQTILIRGARQLLTLNGPSGLRRGEQLSSIGLIEDGAVLIVNGTIAAVGPTRRVENLTEARNAVDFDASGHVVMPAFVDPHAHLMGGPSLVARDDTETLDRSFLDLDRRPRTALATGEIRRTPAKSLEHRARALLQSFARHGSLTIEAKSGYGLDEGAETKLLRVIGQCDGEMTSVIPTFFVPAEAYSTSSAVRGEYLDWLISAFFPKLGSKRLARFIDIECAGEPEVREHTLRLLDGAASSHLPIKMHASEVEGSYLEAAIRHRAASIDGVQRISADAARHLAGAPIVTTLIPADEMEAGAAASTGRMLIDSGVAVALGSGFHHGRTTTYNMQSVLSLACSHLKLTTAEAISAATINAAHAAGAAATAGSLQFGKDADVLILAISDYREISYYFGVNQVQVALKRGETVFNDSAYRL